MQAAANNDVVIKLTTLEGALTVFKTLKSDFGEFSSWNRVPEDLRTSPETKARIQEKRETALAAATVLQAPMAVKSPLRLRSALKYCR